MLLSTVRLKFTCMSKFDRGFTTSAPTSRRGGTNTNTRRCSLDPLSQSLQKEEGGRESSEARVTGRGEQVLLLGIEIHQPRFPALQLPPPIFFSPLYSIFLEEEYRSVGRGSCVSSISKCSLKY